MVNKCNIFTLYFIIIISIKDLLIWPLLIPIWRYQAHLKEDCKIYQRSSLRTVLLLFHLLQFPKY